MSAGNAARVFEDFEAVHGGQPLLIGLVGPSGSGKTFSALRLATGMQRVVGGDIFVIDTEAKRAKAYAPPGGRFKFRHVEFGAPFDPLSYLAAVEHCVRRGARTIIIDSASHMHEGPGGTLEAHEAECERLQNLWRQSREKVQMSAWQKPKAELRRFLNTVLQLNVNTVWCFRAKEKLKIIPGQNPKPLGFMPIAGDEMIYEMTLNCLLYPASNGVPSWHPEELGERAIVKLPEQFKELLGGGRVLDENVGEELARWAAGENKPSAPAANATNGSNDPVAVLRAGYASAATKEEFTALEQQRRTMWPKLSKALKAEVKAASDAASTRLSERAPLDDAGAVALLRAASSAAELESAWDRIIEEYSVAEREIPLAVEDARNIRREALAS